MGSVASLEELKYRRLPARAVDVVTGFIDLTPQCLALLGREPALTAAFPLPAVCAVGFRALLCAGIRLSRLLLCGVVAGVAVRVALLRHTIRGAG